MNNQKILTVKIPEQMHNALMKAVARRIALSPASGYNKSSFVREAIQLLLQQEQLLPFDKQKFAKPEVVDVVDAYVDRVIGDSIHYRFHLNGKEYGATMDRKPFSEAGADFSGAKVQLLTVRTNNPKKPYTLKVVRKSDLEENELGEELEERLNKLSELYEEASEAQANPWVE